jgi:hypothetical protein
VNPDDLIACRETELGDFVLGTYLAHVPTLTVTAQWLDVRVLMLR